MAVRLTAAQRRMYAEFVAEFTRCAACHWAGGWCGFYLRHLENAHIVGGPGRRAERWAILRLCKLCHDLAHGERVRLDGVLLPQITMANLLWLKLEADPDGADMEKLAAVYFKRRLPEPERPHDWYFDQRTWNERRR